MTTDPPVVLDVAQLEALLRKTLNIGLDVGRGKEKVDLVRLPLSKALLGAVEAQALAGQSIPSNAAYRLEGSPRLKAFLATHRRRVERGCPTTGKVDASTRRSAASS